MCAVSAVSDYYTIQFPNRFGYDPFAHAQQHVLMGQLGQQTADAETREMMRKVLQLLDRIDKRLGDIECMDAEKAKFLTALNLDPNNISGG